MSKTNRRPAPFAHVTGRFEYTEAQAREMADAASRSLDATLAHHAAAEGLTVEEYLSADRAFASFFGAAS